VARQRKHFFPVVAALVAILFPSASWAGAPDILLPEPFAVELPAGGTTLGVDDEPMKKLLAATQAGGDRVTALLPRDRVGPGGWRVILSAWSAGVRDRPAARREAVLVVLPHGITPVGATGVGGAPHIARDADGFIHMVWTDGWRAGGREGAMYRRARISPDGSVQFDSKVLDLGPQRGNWTAMPTLAAAGNTIHFAWQSDGTVRYRSLTRVATDWRWSDEIDTKALNTSRDQGPAISADANAVHILNSDGRYMASHDGGLTWSTETIPFGTNPKLGVVSLTLDSAGRPLAATCVLSNDMTPGANGRSAGVRWTTRLARRVGAGAWQVLPGPLNGRAGWSSADRPDEDVICDSFRVLVEPGGAMHAVWQRTPAGGAALGVQAYYAWRPSGGEWHPPVLLATPDPTHRSGRSFAEGLVLDGGTAMPLVSQELHSGWRYRGNDAEFELFRDGEKRAPALTVTRFIRDAMTASEPAAAMSTSSAEPLPTLVHAADGRVWADVLMILSPTRTASPGIIVLQHLDMTDGPRTVGQ
jgi:hypothetical protein